LTPKYLEYAKECIDGAAAASSVSVRVQFIELAQTWLSVAHKHLRQGDGKATLVGFRSTVPPWDDDVAAPPPDEQ
jgi:hypothetical protein